MKTFVKALAILMILIPAAAAIAQTTTTVELSGTVVAVYGNKLVVRMTTGEVKEFTPPADRKFNVDGKELTLAELTPGTKLTATVVTTQTPVTVQTTQIRNGEVVKVVGSQVWIKEGGAVKGYSVPAGFEFIIDGKKVGVDKLRAGSKVTAEIVHTSVRTETSTEVGVAGSAPPPAPAPAPVAAPAPAPAPEPAPAMPKTASNLPLVLLLGVAMLGAGVLIRQ